jgi:hypothetical protein
MSWTNKPPVPTDGWSAVVPAKQMLTQSINAQAEMVSIENTLRNDGWVQTAHDEWQRDIPAGTTVTEDAVRGWGTPWTSNVDRLPSVSDPGYSDAYYPSRDNDRVEQLREAIWTANALDSANTKAGVVNALSGNKDHFNIDQDGELTRLQEITKSVSPGPHGYYIAYHNGRWLHAILSGPYENKDTAMLQASKAYDMMTEDAAFKLAFENRFDRNGIYCAEIPLSAKRHGAYGVLSDG